MTEDEAKEKWCPFVRAPLSWEATEGEPDTLSAAINIGRPSVTCCMASECMAWRWIPITMTDEHIAAVKKAAIDLDDKSASRSKAARDVADNPEKYGLPTKPFRGFCGLAGKP